VEPPFSVVTVMRMEQVMPGSNAWIADIKVVCVCDKDQGGSSEQNLRVGQMYQALEGTASGSDIDRGIELCWFTVDEVRQAKAEKVYSDVIFITAGVAAF